MRSGLAFLFSSVILLTGCSLTPTAASIPESGAAIQGVVHGGQQPVIGAHVFLFQVNTFSYGENSLSLMTDKPGLTTLDTSGGATNGYYYVTTASDGTFSVSGDYNCNSGAQVYLYAVGGNPGSGANSAAGFLAPLGACPSSSFFPTSTFVYMNEVTTIATAYALAGFATDAVHISSSGTTLAQQGVANAFANINNLVSSSGAALATTPSGAGTVPQTLINSLANILAACINSTGPTSSACSTLLSNAKSGGTTGTTPTDTATAAINIAHNPAANVSTIFGIPTPTPPFAPALPSSPVPNDFTLELIFTAPSISAPYSLAIDGSGNVWATNISKATLTEISNSGSLLSGANGYSGGDPFNFFDGLAIDTAGNAWVTDAPDNALIEFSSTGVAGSPIVATGVEAPVALAFSGSDNIWIANNSSFSVSVLTSSGTQVAGTPYTGGGLNYPLAIALDGSGNAWVISNHQNDVGSDVAKLSSTGVSKAGTTGYTADFLNPQAIAIDGSGDAWISDQQAGIIEISSTGSYLSTGYKGGGISSPDGIAIDGAGNAWIADCSVQSAGDGFIVEISSTGTYLSGSKGYASAVPGCIGIGVDGSGNVWFSNTDNNFISELIGAATPVVTPIALGVKNNTLGTRP